MSKEPVQYNRDMKNNSDIKKYLQNDHHMSFLLDPLNLEMYVDYGKHVTEEEMIEAGVQIVANILDRIPVERKTEAAAEIISEIKQYVVSTGSQA